MPNQGDGRENTDVELAKLNPNWRRRALSSARLLDDVVDSQVSLVPQLPEGARARAAEHLTELVMLGQAYRHYAAGWISGRELRRRGKATLARLELVRHPRLEQLTERE